MGIANQLHTYLHVLPSARRNRTDLLRWLAHRPQLLAANAAYEGALVFSAKMEPSLKALAELKAAAMINCAYCLDIGSALARFEGVTEAQLRALPEFADSTEFSELEKLVLQFAEAMSRTPAAISDELRERLLEHFSRAEFTELAATISRENDRARLNQALGVRPSGFSDGAACAVPER